jgi:hypothetical protein
VRIDLPPISRWLKIIWRPWRSALVGRSHTANDDMKDEYDFSKAERGRFFRSGAVLVPPMHQDKDTLPKGNIYDTK